MTQDFFCLSGSWVNHSKNKFFCLNTIPKPKRIIKLLFSLMHTSNSETPRFTWFHEIQNFLFPFRCKLYLEFWLLSGQRGNKIIVIWGLIHIINITNHFGQTVWFEVLYFTLICLVNPLLLGTPGLPFLSHEAQPCLGYPERAQYHLPECFLQ